MDTLKLSRQFAAIGARLKLHRLPEDPRTDRVRIDLLRDREGEYLDITCSAHLELSVTDCRPRERHLVLLVWKDGRSMGSFLCGHDERHFFAAAVRGATNVPAAMEALKPSEVRLAQDHCRGLGYHRRFRRKNRAFIRQGEWFFVPADDLGYTRIPPVILTNHSLGGRKPHVCQYYIQRGWGYAKGWVKHPDHRTIWLPGWHHVHRNTATWSPGGGTALGD
jgi:hypothetical protein